MFQRLAIMSRLIPFIGLEMHTITTITNIGHFYTLQSVIFNYMTELSATILELIYENNKESVTQNNQPVNGEHQQTN